MNNFDEFREQIVDEQIEALAGKAGEQSINGRVVNDLRALYADDARVIEHVWERLERRQAQRIGQGPLRNDFLEQRWENDSHMETTVQTIRPEKRRLALTAKLLIAAMVVIVVTSSVVIFMWVGQTTRLATSFVGRVNTTAGIYIAAADGIYRLTTTGKVMWHHAVDEPIELTTPTPVPTPTVAPTPVQGTPAPTPGVHGQASQPKLLMGVTPPVVLYGKVYFTLFNERNFQTGVLVALDAATGRELWRKSMDDAIFITSIIVKNDVLYLGTYSSHTTMGTLVYAFKPDGALLWSSPQSSWFASVTVVTQDLVYVRTDEGIRALNTNNGKPRWLTPFASFPKQTEQLGASPVMLVNGKLYLVYYLNDGRREFSALYAYDPASGREVWHISDIGHATTMLQTYLNYFLVGSDDMLYMTADNAQLYALNTKTREVVWSRSGVKTPPLLSGDLVIADTQENGIVAYDAARGGKRWSQGVNLNSNEAVMPIVVAGKLYYIGLSEMGALDVHNGKKLWQAPLPAKHIAFMTIVE